MKAQAVDKLQFYFSYNWQLQLLMIKKSMHVMQEYGGLLKTNWHIWNRFAQFRNIGTEDLLRQLCLNCIEERRH